MSLNIQLPDELGAVVTARAQAQGISADRYVSTVLESVFDARGDDRGGPPFETGYGMWSQYGPAPSAEEIDENRREMFHNFGNNF